MGLMKWLSGLRDESCKPEAPHFQEYLNTAAEELFAHGQSRAVIESKRCELNEEDSIKLFIDAGDKVIDRLMYEYNASLDEAIDAYMNACVGRTVDRYWLMDFNRKQMALNSKL